MTEKETIKFHQKLFSYLPTPKRGQSKMNVVRQLGLEVFEFEGNVTVQVALSQNLRILKLSKNRLYRFESRLQNKKK